MKPFHYNQDPMYAAAAAILTGQQLTEEVAEFTNQGFILVGNPKGNPFLRDAVNSSIKSAVNKLSDVTWNLVTDIYGKRDNGAYADDWILQRKGGDAWLTIKDGGQFKAHSSISSVLSFFELQESMKDMEKIYNDFKSLIGKQVLHGSPGYGEKEIIKKITPQIPNGVDSNFKVDFESGFFDVLSQDELYDLIDGKEVEYRSPHGGMSVIELQEDENPSSSKHMIANQLQTIIRNSEECLQMIEDDRKFPEWAQSKIAVAEHGIVGVTEYMNSHDSGEELKEAPLKDILPTKEDKQRLELFMKKFNALRDEFPDVLMRGTYDEKVNAGLLDNKSGNVIKIGMDIPFVHNKFGKATAESYTKDEASETKYTFINAVRHARKTRNAAALKTATDNLKNWAVKNNAMKDPEVLDFIESYTKDDAMDEASPFKMGTATITAPGNPLHGKQANVFHKFDDGRINVQYSKSDKKGDVLNITLNKGQYKLDEATSDELSALSKVMLSMEASYGDINNVRSKLDSEVSGKFLVSLASTIANDTDAFNAFVKAQSKQ